MPGLGDGSAPIHRRQWHDPPPRHLGRGTLVQRMSDDPQEPLDVQRVLMDRARRMAERDQERIERPLAARLVGLALALLVVLVVLFAFDRFLASMQRFLALPVTDPQPSVTEPMSTYAVPGEPQAADATSSAPDAASQPSSTPRD